MRLHHLNCISSCPCTPRSTRTNWITYPALSHDVFEFEAAAHRGVMTLPGTDTRVENSRSNKTIRPIAAFVGTVWSAIS
jgi:hypothetical protein